MLKNLFVRDAHDRELTRIEKRVATLSESELISWGDNLITDAGRHLSAYRRELDTGALAEFSVASSALVAVAAELQKRC